LKFEPFFDTKTFGVLVFKKKKEEEKETTFFEKLEKE
jgi:hypothetical protein